jgi:hypothetical protein
MIVAILAVIAEYSTYNKPSQREFYSLKNAHKIPCLGRYVFKDGKYE